MTGDAVRQPRARTQTLAGCRDPVGDCHNAIVRRVSARNGDLASFVAVAAQDGMCGTAIAFQRYRDL